MLDGLIKNKFSKAIKIYEDTMQAGIKLVKKYIPRGINEQNIENFVLTGQGVGGIAGLIYNEYVNRGDLCNIKDNALFTPTCYLIIG